MTSTYETARKHGYTDEEIKEYLSQKDADFAPKYDKAIESGYSSDEIFQFTSKQKKPKESKLKSALRTGYQPIAGYLKKFTYIPDILHMASVGEALDPEFLDRLREIHKQEGIEFDEDTYRKKVAEASKVFPTQENLEQFIEEKTGLPLTPQTGLQKSLRLAGTAGGFQPGSLIQKATAAVTAPAVSGLAQELGIPESLAEILGLGGGAGAATGRIAQRALTPEQQMARRIAGKHGLPTYAGMEVEGVPKVSPVVSKESQAALQKELGESSEKAIDTIITEQLPLNKAEELGINPEIIYERSYERMNETAKEIDAEIAAGTKKPIDIQPVLDWIKEQIAKIKKSAPSLSTPDKTRLKILENEYRSLSQTPEKLPPEAVQLVDIHGKPLVKQKKARQPKEINASQAIDQTRNYNENVRDLYKKPEFTGAQQEVRETFAQLNDQVQQAIKNSGEKDLARQLWFGNQVFHETSKVNVVNNILKPAFENGFNASKLASILRSGRNRKFLERALGKGAVKDLIDISHYGNRAEEFVFKRLKSPMTAGEYLSTMTPLKAGLLLLKHGATAGLGTAYEIGKGLSQRVAGKLFTRPGTRKAYKNFLKGAISPKKSVFSKASEELSKAIEEEFGSEENLQKIVSELEE